MIEDWQKVNCRIDGYLETDIRICLEKNEDTYLERFWYLPQRRFNVCAAIFGSKWFAYRLMIKEGSLLWFIDLVVSGTIYALILIMGGRRIIDIHYMNTALKASGILTFLILFFVQGFIADQLYWKHLKKELEVVGRFNSKDSILEEEIEKLKGETGVSIKSIILFSILWGLGSELFTKFIMFPIVYWLVGLR